MSSKSSKKSEGTKESKEPTIYFVPVLDGNLVVDSKVLNKELETNFSAYVCHHSGHEIHATKKIECLETKKAKDNGVQIRT